MAKSKCRFCGAPTDKRVWTKGTKRLFTPICDKVTCWKKYWRKTEGR